MQGIADSAKQLTDRMNRFQAAAKSGEVKLINGPAGTYADLNEPKTEE